MDCAPRTVDQLAEPEFLPNVLPPVDGSTDYVVPAYGKTRVLEEAAEKVAGPRQQQYGPPHLNHDCTAGFWNLYLSRRFDSRPVEINGTDVCLLNILQKVSRLANDPTHLDSLVDIAGFAQNAWMCVEASGE